MTTKRGQEMDLSIFLLLTSHSIFLVTALAGLMLGANGAISADDPTTGLPPGVRANWGLNQAFREGTLTRERVCLNGLWRWQPAEPLTLNPSPVELANSWGYFKVPGCWPGITDYMQKDCQTVYPHPSWKETKLSGITAAWYEREITVPEKWAGRRITLDVEYLNSFAIVQIDGRKAGEIRFPAGELDLTALVAPGSKHRLSIGVTAMPLKGVMLSYTDTAGAKDVKGKVERRGLCGDVFLVGTPPEARIGHVKISTSVRKWEITFDAALQGEVGE